MRASWLKHPQQGMAPAGSLNGQARPGAAAAGGRAVGWAIGWEGGWVSGADAARLSHVVLILLKGPQLWTKYGVTAGEATLAQAVARPSS